VEIICAYHSHYVRDAHLAIASCVFDGLVEEYLERLE
jgi:hypothetical protein